MLQSSTFSFLNFAFQMKFPIAATGASDSNPPLQGLLRDFAGNEIGDGRRHQTGVQKNGSAAAPRQMQGAACH